MNNFLFNELINSVQEAGQINRNEKPAFRSFEHSPLATIPLTTKVQEVVDSLINELKIIYPKLEIVSLDLDVGREDSEPDIDIDCDAWLRIVTPEENESEFSRIVAERCTDILVEHDIDIRVTYAR